MATTFTNWAKAANAAIVTDSYKGVYVLSNRLDFSETNTDGASDVIQALAIPAKTMVIDVLTKLVTPEGAALTATVGDGSSAAGWDGSVDLNTTAGTVTQSVQGTDARNAANAMGYVYTAADTIDLVLSAAADTAVIDVFAICVDLNV